MTHTSRTADLRFTAAREAAPGQLAVGQDWQGTDTRNREQEQQREIRLLTFLLRQEEERSADSANLLAWFAQVHRSFQTQPRRWFLLPEATRHKLQRRRLRRAGLFDSEAYLEHYPDVAASGIDPLHHYMRHGVHEGRIGGIKSEAGYD